MTISLVYDISFIIHKQKHTIPFSWVSNIYFFFKRKLYLLLFCKGCIKLIITDSKDFYIVTKCFYFLFKFFLNKCCQTFPE